MDDRFLPHSTSGKILVSTNTHENFDNGAAPGRHLFCFSFMLLLN